MHMPEAVANYFIIKAWGYNKDLTPIQVLKLVYIAHGWVMGYTGKELISHEVVAWRYGPVIPSLYQRFKHFGNQSIDELAEDFDFPYEAQYSGDESDIIGAVWDKYGDMNGMQLSALTHDRGTPWDQVWNDEGGSKRKNAIIANEKIKTYYEKLIENATHSNG